MIRDGAMVLARALRLACVALLMALAMSCDRGAKDDAPARVEYRETPRASVRGSVIVPAGMSPLGVQVFAEGTGHQAFTDTNGNFTISGLPAGAYRLQAMRVDIETTLVADITVAEADLAAPQPYQTLQPASLSARRTPLAMATPAPAAGTGSVRGSITTEIASDTPGALVTLKGTTLRTVTGAFGEFAFAEVPAGTQTLEVSREGFRTISMQVVVDAGQETRMGTLVFERLRPANEPRTVYGTVRKDGQAPTDGTLDLSDISVFLEGTNYAAKPDAQGRFQINDVRAGVYTVSATAPGWVAAELFQVDLFEIPAAEVAMVLVAGEDPTQAPAILGGRIVADDTDEPLAGVLVTLEGTSRVATTGADGIFVIDDITPGTYNLRAELTDFFPAVIEGLTIEGGDDFSLDDIRLEPDVERPEVIFADPRDGSRNVAIEDPTYVTIQFSLPMDEATVRSAINVSPAVDYDISFESGAQPSTRRHESGADTVVLELRGWARAGEGAPLRFRTRYTVTVAGSAESADGVAMEDDFSMTFQTGGARLIATFPEDNQKDILPTSNQPMKLVFNAPLNRATLKPSDIDISPRPFEQPTIWFRDDPETGWTEAYVQIDWEPEERYRIRVGGRASTITRDRIENLPYSFEFRTPRRLTAEDALDLNENTENRRRQERDRRR